MKVIIKFFLILLFMINCIFFFCEDGTSDYSKDETAEYSKDLAIGGGIIPIFYQLI